MTELPPGYTQITLTDMIEATASAVEQVEVNSAPWRALARRAVEWVAIHRERFTTDAVWAVLDRVVQRPPEPRAMGSVMRWAVSEGICKPTGEYTQSSRHTTAQGTVHHTGPVAVYQSRVFGTGRHVEWPPR